MRSAASEPSLEVTGSGLDKMKRSNKAFCSERDLAIEHGFPVIIVLRTSGAAGALLVFSDGDIHRSQTAGITFAVADDGTPGRKIDTGRQGGG